MTGYRNFVVLVVVSAAALFSLSGCSSGAPSLTGTWSPDDGSPTKVISDNGQCTGMYYNGGKVLDIGGGATCTLSSKATNGKYDLVVQQSPNQETLQAEFTGSDTLTLYSGSTKLVTLTRK